MKLTHIATGIVIAMAASVASADYLKFGFDENEVYTGSDAATNVYRPTIVFGVNPIANSPLKIEGYMRESVDDRSTSQDASNTRSQLKFSYAMDFGDYTFAPAIRLRRDAKDGSHDRELHLFANNSYKLSDAASVFLNLYVNNWTNKPADGSQQKKHLDYEVALGTKLALTSMNTFSVQVFTEQKKAKSNNASAEVNNQDWELRASLSHKFNDALSGNVFGRYTFKDQEESNGVTSDTAKDFRLGVGLKHAVNEDWSVSGNVFYQQEHKSFASGTNTADQNKDASKKYVYSLWVTRSF